MAKKLMNKGYDLSSSPIHRVFRHYILSRCIPLGAYQGGGGLKCITIFFITHYFGRSLFLFFTRFEPQVTKLHEIRKRLFS